MKKRIENDFYETPVPLTVKLIEVLEGSGLLKVGQSVLEPCIGDWSIGTCLARQGYKVVSNDIDKNKQADYHEDASYISAQCYLDRPDWIVTNPPFSKSADILHASLETAKAGVVMLLRLTFLEPTSRGNNRREILQKYQDCMRFIIPVNPRPQFRMDVGDKGTDSVTVAWFVWDKQWSWKDRNIICPFQFNLVDWRD